MDKLTSWMWVLLMQWLAQVFKDIWF